MLLRTLTEQHGPLMFHQSGGCCDGSSPMCYPVGMFATGSGDVLLGEIDAGLEQPIEVYMSRSQFEYWKYTHLDDRRRGGPRRRLQRGGADRQEVPDPVAPAR